MKKLILSVFCVIVVFSVFQFNVCAEEINTITVLGDSIAEGYALEEGDKNYGVWLGDYFDAKVENYASAGKTTQELIDMIDNDKSVRESVKDAELICVSIGANDILELFFDDLVNMAQSYNESADGELNIPSEAVENIITSIATSIGPASANAGKNIDVIIDKLKAINPGARLVFQTVYNPFETNNETLKPLFSPLYAFASIYLSSVNNAIRNNTYIENADIREKFKGYCSMYTNIDSLDIHPNRLGHIVIAEEIVQTLKIPGKTDIFTYNIEDVIGDSPWDLPHDLREEIKELSNGIFRKEEPPTEAYTEIVTEVMTEPPTENKMSEIKPAAKANRLATIIQFAVIIIMAVIFFVVIPVIILFVLTKNKNKNKDMGEDKK